MPTQLKSDTARVNGAKSQGPKTAQGREISSHNSTKHGLSARNPVVLECENAAHFEAVHDSQMEIHQPATPAEKDLVDQMVAARWRILRLQSIESDLLDTELRQKEEIELELDSGRKTRLSEAYTAQANNSRAMALASRHEARLNRMYQTSYKVLRDLQASRLKQSTQTAAPEPAQPRRPGPAQRSPPKPGPPPTRPRKKMRHPTQSQDVGPPEIRNPLAPPPRARWNQPKPSPPSTSPRKEM